MLFTLQFHLMFCQENTEITIQRLRPVHDKGRVSILTCLGVE